MLPVERPKGLYYCQYSIGIGRLTRSLNICRSLVKEFTVDFMLGGHDINLALDSPHFKQIPLPPLGKEKPFAAYEGGDDQLMNKRLNERKKIIENLNQKYDFFISEFFPFSSWRFKDEVEDLILKIKAINPKCLITSSLRDSFSAISLEREKEELNFFQQHYDYVFVHSDPRVFLLQESFSLADDLGDKVIYTGFINNPDLDVSPKPRQKRIVVSTGGGSYGEELIYASIKAAPFFPDYEFALILGPIMPKQVLPEIKILAQKAGAGNIRIVPFMQNFQEYLCESALSISLGGYTIMDVAYTNTPAIVFPSTLSDQYVRGIKFAAFDFIKLIALEDLQTDRFCRIIEEALSMPPSPFEVDMTGSQTTAGEIKRLLNERIDSKSEK